MTAGSTSGVFIASLLTLSYSRGKEDHAVLLCPGFALFDMFSVYRCENFPVNRRSAASEKTIPSRPNIIISSATIGGNMDDVVSKEEVKKTTVGGNL